MAGNQYYSKKKIIIYIKTIAAESLKWSVGDEDDDIQINNTGDINEEQLTQEIEEVIEENEIIEESDDESEYDS